MDKEMIDSNIKAVKEMLKKSKKGALSLAVAFTVSSALTGCNNLTKREDTSYLVGNGTGDFSNNQSSSSGSYNGGSGTGHHYYGGSYYYGRGATYRGGSWGTAPTTVSTVKSGFGGGSYKGIGG